MSRLIEAVRRNPYIVTATLSGAVCILAVVGVISTATATFAQGVLSIVLGMALAATTLQTDKAIRRHVAIRRAAREGTTP